MVGSSVVLGNEELTLDWIARIKSKGCQVSETTMRLVNDEIFDGAAFAAFDSALHLGFLDDELRAHAEHLLAQNVFGRSTEYVSDLLQELAEAA